MTDRKRQTTRPWVTLLAILIGATVLPLQAQTLVMDTADRRIHQLEGDFEFYREMLENAIAGEGLVINTIGYIAEMLDRTGADLGAQTSLYRHGISVEFCSARYSRAMMEADFHSIVFCPYVITLYEGTAQPGILYLGYQRMPAVTDATANQTLRDIDALLERIVQETLAF